jgi:hypothetical protein
VVTVSSEVPAQTEARLRGVFRRSQVAWLPGSWEFVEGAEATGRHDAIAVIRDEGQVSALCPAGTAVAEGFAVFRVVLPRDADDSGFVGWLASRVKAATGSGLFVVCGQNRERGGVFDYYGVPEAVSGPVRAALERLRSTGSFDGAVMRVVRAAPNARIGPDTVFCFDLDGRRLSARYGGGAVTEGWLVGDLDPATSQARFHYLQVGVDGSAEAGESVAELDRTEDGRWRLTEHFTWSSGEGSGTNQLQEANA